MDKAYISEVERDLPTWPAGAEESASPLGFKLSSLSFLGIYWECWRPADSSRLGERMDCDEREDRLCQEESYYESEI